MSIETASMLAGAGAFTVVVGANDGGALVAAGRSVRGLTPVVCFALLAAAVVISPLLIGSGVAETLTGRLVDFESGSGGSDFLPAVLAVVAVVSVLGAFGLPTSITLSLVGGITGAGLAAGATVGWGTVGLVLAMGALAPLVGAVMARILAWASGWVPVPEGLPARVRWLHVVGFLLICVAYGANDGQKMLAVWAAVQSGSPNALSVSPLALATITGCFLVGGMIGLPRLAAALAGQLTSGRSDAAVVTELSGAGVVLGTAALGAPVSMTQSLSGAMVGTGLAGWSAPTRRPPWHRRSPGSC